MKIVNGERFSFITEYLYVHNIMSLASSNGLNICNSNVHFISDKWLNLYFMSDLCAEYADNVLGHPQVALTFSDDNDHFAKSRSIQAKGICEIMSENRWPRILKLWNEKYKEEQMSLEDLKKRHLCLFKIVLTRLRYYDMNLTEKVLEIDF